MCRGEATISAAECTNRREIDADEMEQGIAELEYVFARYGMLKSWFSSSSSSGSGSGNGSGSSMSQTA